MVVRVVADACERSSGATESKTLVAISTASDEARFASTTKVKVAEQTRDILQPRLVVSGKDKKASRMIADRFLCVYKMLHQSGFPCPLTLVNQNHPPSPSGHVTSAP